VTVNGLPAGRARNMHRRYRFDVAALLRPGANELTIEFTAPYEYAEAQAARLGARPGPYDEPYAFIRKMACNFGWDWGPTLVTAGIWRPIGLHSWSAACAPRASWRPGSAN
jgi:beta-mannosidase